MCDFLYFPHQRAPKMASRNMRLFVGNIPWTVSKKELRDYFSNFGIVRSAIVLFNNKTGMHRGFGFVDFRNQDGYNAAVSQETHTLENSKLVIASGSQRVAGRRQQLE